VPDLCNCDMGCCDVAHPHSINLYYESIVSSLQTASCLSVSCVRVHSLKPFWNEDLERLKADSVFWHDTWTSADRPKTGTLQQLRLSCKAKYKQLGIRNAYANFEDKLSDEMCYHFANKNPPEFWKTWHAKFRRNVNKNVNINGYTDNYDIAEEFSKHF